MPEISQYEQSRESSKQNRLIQKLLHLVDHPASRPGDEFMVVVVEYLERQRSFCSFLRRR